MNLLHEPATYDCTPGETSSSSRTRADGHFRRATLAHRAAKNDTQSLENVSGQELEIDVRGGGCGMPDAGKGKGRCKKVRRSTSYFVLCTSYFPRVSERRGHVAVDAYFKRATNPACSK
jgi:hypothetical protein